MSGSSVPIHPFWTLLPANSRVCDYWVTLGNHWEGSELIVGQICISFITCSAFDLEILVVMRLARIWTFRTFVQLTDKL
jgi:hypothetical protein